MVRDFGATQYSPALNFDRCKNTVIKQFNPHYANTIRILYPKCWFSTQNSSRNFTQIDAFWINRTQVIRKLIRVPCNLFSIHFL